MAPRKPKGNQESTETQTQTEPAGATAIADAPATENDAESPGFAERVGKKNWTPTPDPYQLAHDNVAKVALFESKQDRQMAIMFGDGFGEDKPSQAVLDTVKAAGYRWDRSDRIWAHPVRAETAKTTRFAAERLYKEVCSMIRKEKGIEAEQELPF